MIKSLKLNPGNGDTTSDGDEILATATVTLECGAIIRGIEVVRTEGKVKVSRDSRPLFTTKELRKQFCEKVLSEYLANLATA